MKNNLKKKNRFTVTPLQGKADKPHLKPAEFQYQYQPSRSLVATGKDSFKRDENPEFHGHIIFCNGYLSSVTKNKGAQVNAIMDVSRDEGEWYALQGANANEKNKTDTSDIYYPEEYGGILPDNKKLDVTALKKIMKENTKKKSYTDFDRYWGYWNDVSNRFYGSATFAGYFNAQGNEYFINGSHGLGSSAHHRIDHGIILGNEWAKKAWGIFSKKMFDGIKDKKSKEYLKTFTPPYRPVTIVGHSQGAACAAGVALGVLNYANKMGWEEIPINIIFLGVHQPINLTGRDYDDFIEQKKNYYGVDRTLPTFMAEKAKKGKEFINSLADLFNTEYNKLKHEKGIYEHLKEICGDWQAYKDRAVQFTFTNDRGDTVTRDGDIPAIDSACDPERDSTLFSIEIFMGEEDRGTMDYTTFQKKKKIDILDTDGKHLGRLYLPPFLANRRIEFNEDGTEEIWESYESLAITYATSFLRYMWARQYYEKKFGPYDCYNTGPVEIVLESVLKGSVLALYLLSSTNPFESFKMLYRGVVDSLYVESLEDYAAIQAADLYAHFSPVGLITNRKILDDWRYPGDSLGTIENIWERIMKAGGKKFYRVQIDNKVDSEGRYIYEKTNIKKYENQIKETVEQTKSFISSGVGNTTIVNQTILGIKK